MIEDLRHNGYTTVHLRGAAQLVQINPAQHFAPAPPEVWEYQVVGYQVSENWPKDRHDRRLELEEVRTHGHIVTALAGTIELQQEISVPYPAAEAETISGWDAKCVAPPQVPRPWQAATEVAPEGACGRTPACAGEGITCAFGIEALAGLADGRDWQETG